jgi:hypothetical protein
VRFFCGVILTLLAPKALALELPQTGISYTIEVRIDPATRGIAGRETIRWTNPSDAPVAALPIHLYLNAFSHTQTTWLREQALDRDELDDLYRLADDPWGWIETRSIVQRVGAERRPLVSRPIQPDDGNPLDRTLLDVDLAEPVAPGGETSLEIEFEGQLPVPIARTGAVDSFFFLGQWYPKIGMLDTTGVRGASAPRWAARQFHANSEFYAEFADYDVTIEAPEGWTVGATGRESGTGSTRHRFVQRAVHDFAAVAGRDLAEQRFRVVPEGGGPPVDVRHIVPKGTEHQIPRWHGALVAAMNELGRRVGPYPYDVLTVVTPPYPAIEVGGMEYPTLFTGILGDPFWDRSGMSGLLLPEITVIHEYAHQYFYGLVATNEQEEAFLDEGLTTYWECSIADAAYGSDRGMGTLFGRAVGCEDSYDSSIERGTKLREPIRHGPTALYAEHTWSRQVYDRTLTTLLTAERLFGRATLDRVFAEYFRRFAFHHPDLDDLLRVAAEAGGPELAAMLREGFDRDSVPDYAVTEATAERWSPPEGRLPTADGVLTLGPDGEDEHPEAGLDPEAREEDSRILVEITDPGWARNVDSHLGSVRRVSIDPTRGAADAEFASGDEAWYESTVLLSGPSWDHLPVDVELRFADGVTIRDRWDGKAAWRKYRMVRAAPLTDVRVDPEHRIAVDVVPQNNARSVEPSAPFVRSWSAWLTAAAQWLGGSAAAWF